MTLTMGNITLNLAVDGKLMGQSYLDNLILRPGNNTAPMTSSVDVTAVVRSLLLDSAYEDGVVPFVVTGASSFYHGMELPYFTKALRALNLTVNLNVSRALSQILVHP